MLRRSACAGFTLIELLVVIAIIAILAAILFPVFVSTRERANTAKCQGHEKQLISGLMLYVEDYAGRLPRMQFLSVPGIDVPLCRPYVRSYAILRCSGSLYKSSRLGGMQRPAFAYNEGCLCAPLSTMIRSGVQHSYVMQMNWSTMRDYNKWPGRPTADVSNSRFTPAFFCSESYHGSRWTGEAYGYGWEPWDIVDGPRMINPHGGGANYAFLDGHVSWFLPEGGGFYMRTEGIDYDGNGTIGEKGYMR